MNTDFACSTGSTGSPFEEILFDSHNHLRPNNTLFPFEREHRWGKNKFVCFPEVSALRGIFFVMEVKTGPVKYLVSHQWTVRGETDILISSLIFTKTNNSNYLKSA